MVPLTAVVLVALAISSSCDDVRFRRESRIYYVDDDGRDQNLQPTSRPSVDRYSNDYESVGGGGGDGGGTGRGILGKILGGGVGGGGGLGLKIGNKGGILEDIIGSVGIDFSGGGGGGIGEGKGSGFFIRFFNR
ncbi:hypothetical protein Trydic_g14484 [Trypoxylus dichotomus]